MLKLVQREKLGHGILKGNKYRLYVFTYRKNTLRILILLLQLFDNGNTYLLMIQNRTNNV